MLWALSNKWANLLCFKLALTKLRRRRFVLLDSNPDCRMKAGEVVGTVSRALPPAAAAGKCDMREHASMTQARCSVNCQTFAKHIIGEENRHLGNQARRIPARVLSAKARDHVYIYIYIYVS